MQSAKSGVSRVLGLPAKLISAPEASIRSCHVLTVTVEVSNYTGCPAAQGGTLVYRTGQPVYCTRFPKTT
jgi:hypothetical protein